MGILGAVAMVGSALIASDSASSAASAQSNAAASSAQAQLQASQNQAEAIKYATDKQLALQDKMFNLQRNDQLPFLNLGLNSARNLSNLVNSLSITKPSAGINRPALPEDFNFQFDDKALENSKAYQFRMNQGQRALEASAAAKGSLFSGATGKSLLNFAQGLASTEFGNEYNRQYTAANDDYTRRYGKAMDIYNQNVNQYNRQYGQYNDAMNRLASLAGVGQTAASAMGSAASNYGAQASNTYANQGNQMSQVYGNQGQALSNMYINQGNAQAANYGAQANIMNSALNNGVSMYQLSKMGYM